MEVYQDHGYLTIYIDEWKVQWFSQQDHISGQHAHGDWEVDPIWMDTDKGQACPRCNEVFPIKVEELRTMVKFHRFANGV